MFAHLISLINYYLIIGSVSCLSIQIQNWLSSHQKGGCRIDCENKWLLISAFVSPTTPLSPSLFLQIQELNITKRKAERSLKEQRGGVVQALLALQLIDGWN